MCEIVDTQLLGELPDVNGRPTRLRVDVRLVDCPFVDIEIFRGSDPIPLVAVTAVPAVQDPQLAQNLATQLFVLTSSNQVRCGERLTVHVVCSTDNNCEKTFDQEVRCKDLTDPGCPTDGPALNVQPPVPGPFGDCIPGAVYTVTMGGTWPPGTLFSWKVGPISAGIATLTDNHTDTFVLDHPAGSPGKIIIAGVRPPTCDYEANSFAHFPAAGNVVCPTTVTFTIDGAERTWASGDDGAIVVELPPGDHTLRVTSPTGGTYQWFRDNAFTEPGPVPEELLLPSLPPNTSIPVAVYVQVPCCSPLLPAIILNVSTGSIPTDPSDGSNPDDTEPNRPTEIPPPSCAALYLLVGLGLILALVALVFASSLAPLGVGVVTFLSGMVVAIGLAILLLLICGPDWCRIIGALVWALKWSILLGFLLSIAFLSLSALLAVLIIGMTIAGLIWWLTDNGCPVPSMMSFP